MSQTLHSPKTRPPLRTRVAARTAVAAARLLAHLPPRRIVAVLILLRHGTRPATHAQALDARTAVTATSTMCAGRHCLQRSLAATLLCRLRGHWPTWCTGVRTPPFAAHAWIQADGRPVGEPSDITGYGIILSVPPSPDRGPGGLTGTVPDHPVDTGR
ncbi:lasso peptide biosynthesis B2 protein [Streptosporangium sp. NPDC049376]|uniref:lasso peptide biosynthesis B2 protein n=1 Tax=Streptosporangium sp. NPDC049376 TaxID=3366192 RepID=UPI0037B6FF56